MNVSSFHASEWWILVSTPCVTWPFKQIWLLDSYINTTFTTWLIEPLIILILFCHREQSYRSDEAWSYLYYWANDFTRWVVKPLQLVSHKIYQATRAWCRAKNAHLSPKCPGFYSPILHLALPSEKFPCVLVPSHYKPIFGLSDVWKQGTQS